MDKEQSEEVKDVLDSVKRDLERADSRWWNFDTQDIEELVSTVEEQQKEIEGRKRFESRRVQQVNNLIERNKRYSQALDAINLLINQDFWNSDELENGIKQQIEKARQALEGEN